MLKVLPDKRLVVLPHDPAIAALVPAAKVHGQVMALPYHEDVVRLLRNYGHEVDAPIRHYYDWRGVTPFTSQVATADLLTTNTRAYVLNEFGTGKTLAALFAFDYLRARQHARSALVVAPLSTLQFTWEAEAFRHFPHLTTSVLYGDKSRRLARLATPADLYIVNHDGVKVILPELLERKDIDLILVDELAEYRTAGTARWKVMKALLDGRKYVWGMTGAPTPNAPTDVWGQSKLITPHTVPKSFYGYRLETMRKISQFRWAPKPNATERALQALQPSVRFTRADDQSLPPVLYTEREVAMPRPTAEAYKEMLQECAALGGAAVAVNEGVKLSKLLQIATGWVYDREGTAHYVGGAGRVLAVKEIVEQAEAKVIVFCPFKFLAKLMAAALSKWYRVGLIHGDVPAGRRNEVFHEFQHGNLEVLVAHPETMSHGLTLVAANVIVWASPTMSLDIYDQANARITRAGQEHTAHVIHLVGSGAERKVYTRLRGKSKLQGALLELLEGR